jgi:toxin CptA
LWLLLLSFVVFDSVRSQRRINACQGEIKLLMDSRLRWQGKDWDIIGMPWMLNSGMMLRLRKVDGGRRQHLWLSADSMDTAEWRDLRRMILQQPTQE